MGGDKMECYKIENLTFKYPSGTENALSDISLCVNQGEFILLCGKSGCGKTTLLRLLKSVLAPHGEMNGNIYFYEESLDKVAQDIQAEKIGFVNHFNSTCHHYRCPTNVTNPRNNRTGS